MALYRKSLPQLGGELFLTDGGIETTLIFLEGLELPLFAAFDLLRTPEGEAALRRYFTTYAALAERLEVGLVLETASWRSNPDWGSRLGYGRDDLASVNRKLVRMLEDIRAEHASQRTPIVISGCIGPRGDGYVPDHAMSTSEAEAYHSPQVETFADSAADLVTAITMNHVEEAAGITLAARRVNMPVVISFTVETDGKLPTGQSLGDAITSIDELSAGYPAYYMINCAHPSHFDTVVRGSDPWTARIRGLRANASRMSHAELNECSELDVGNPAQLGREYADLKQQQLRQLNVIGGCCGTDHRHVEQLALACLPLFR
ncbi:homocysteine S-methyltransferase family protein [Perlucidibaca piscinae]|uniref:homocysteine S-methyltransferase family protein n=1 Tax=Perlucidibaca piscinae TaxID=392589 RepID=UPI0003B31FDB|nr:homocysteine S-methyltransferase family protein [Perlucidibaca piscinae]